MRIKIAIAALAAAMMCIAAFGPVGASATQLEQCGGTGTATAVSCGGGVFWTKVPANTRVTVTGVGVSTLKATIAGIELEIKCLSQMGEATLSNTGSGSVSQIKGKGENSYSGCEVVKPAFVCTVEEPINTVELEQETILETMKDKYKRPGGGAIVALNILGEACPLALKGGKAVTGSATAEGNETTGEESFTATSGSELKVAGQAATFTSTIKYDTLGTNTQVFSRTP